MAKIAFTAPRVANFKCPSAKQQAFLWDATAPGLGLRTTPAGQPSYVFQGLYEGKTIRITIGSPAAWTIPNAQAKARELQRQIDEGHDPRELKREAAEARKQKMAAEVAAAEQAKKDAAAAALTVAEAWRAYLEARRPYWGEAHYNDHLKLARSGGQIAKRGTRGRGVTIAMPLHALMGLPLRSLDAVTVEGWAAREAKSRPTSTRLAWRLLKVFLNWCAEQPEYVGLLPAKNPAATRKTREALGKPKAKTDVLLREQLPAWFNAVRSIGNATISAALQVMLLTGARPGEVLSLRWEDVNLQWRGLTIRDKVEGERIIPMTPYVQSLLDGLPRRNDWVFASTRAVMMDSKNKARRERRAQAKGEAVKLGEVVEGSATGYITEPRSHHACACKTAGIEGLTLHGLRRSFKSLTEWLDIPAGVVAQIMGHKPSATAEKHYTVRPLDLLRLHHERIEAWMLEQAGVPLVARPQAHKLHVVG
ncbi:integrase family protein [Variovorax defluvii]|uniref:Integrase family protein n=1 Tax=Variovorax defluvii TaxID=913761 RepID=A0ABP8I7G7_9BURK